MRQFLSLSTFHLKLFARNGYFVSTMLTSTLGMLLLQYVIAYAANTLSDPFLWVRAGIFGLWSCAVTAAGAIGFQRFQGTLPYLLNNAVSDAVSLAALLMPCSAFGLLAFPFSFAVSALLGMNVTIHLPQMIAVVMLWLGALVLDFAIAAFFVLTPNALVYEELILIPFMLLGGLLEAPGHWQTVIEWFGWVLPISAPIRILLSGEMRLILLVQFLFSMVLCFVFALVIARSLLKKARVDGTMGVIS